MTRTLDQLDKEVLRLAKLVAGRAQRPRISYRRGSPEETLDDMIAGAARRRVHHAVRVSPPGRTYVRARVAARRSKRVAKATRNSYRKAVKRAPQVLTAMSYLFMPALVLLLIIVLVYMAWVAARKVEWLTGKVVPSSYSCSTQQSGWFSVAGNDTSFVAFVGVMAHGAFNSVTHISAKTEAEALRGAVRMVTGAVAVAQHELSGHTRVNAAPGVPLNGVPAPGAPDLPPNVYTPMPSGFGTCCNTGSSSTTINAGMPVPGDTPAMMAVRAAQAAGFTDLVLADAIAGAESGWNPLATHLNSNGTTDYGMWQINSVHAAVLASGSWQSPADNARMARTVFDGQGWRAWSTFNSGAYRAYLPQAEAAVRAVTGFVGPLPVVPAAAIAPAAAPQTCTPSTFVPTSNTATSPAAETAVRFALAQLGKPYVYGSNGPNSWDCSSLVQAAYAAAGVALPRTTFGQIDAGTVVEPGQERRGDLIFTDPGHVMLALGDGTAVQAPHTGDIVKVSAYARPWQVRRITPTATA